MNRQYYLSRRENKNFLIESKKQSNHWKGGKIINRNYYYIYLPNHHNATKQGYIAEHRLIWEQHNKACLLSWGIVHHKNENTKDNNINNLEAMMKSKHNSIHYSGDKFNNKKEMSDRKCLKCNSSTTYIFRNKIYFWYKFNDGFICRKCYRKKENHLELSILE